MQDSFLKIFNKIKDFSGKGSFIGWLRKVVVNTAITHYHINLKYRYHVGIEEYVPVETGVAGFDEDFFTSDELYKVLNELPKGYRMVFNLYAVEGYKHKEIAEIMGIDTNTSKSQYSRAKAVIRDKLEKLGKLKTAILIYGYKLNYNKLKAKKQDMSLRELFRHKLENAEIIPDPSVKFKLMRKLAMRNS